LAPRSCGEEALLATKLVNPLLTRAEYSANYHLLRRICRKFCFTLYEVRHTHDDSIRFLKVLTSDLAAQTDNVALFFEGARIGQFLKHADMCTVFEYGTKQNSRFMITEHVTMRPLSMLLHESFPLRLKRTIALITRIAAAAQQAHLQGIVHGVLNPTCVYSDGSGPLKVDDFGFQWIAPRLLQLEDAEAVYLSYYLAPEFYLGTQPVDGRADIYSIGAMLLEMLAGDFAFNATVNASCKHHHLQASIAKVQSIYPDNFKKIHLLLSRCLAANPERRYPNFLAFFDALSALRDEKPYAKRPQTTRLKHRPKLS
jgi:serine/threonine-protein kinase